LDTSLWITRPDIATGLQPEVMIIGYGDGGLAFGAPKGSFARGNRIEMNLKIQEPSSRPKIVKVQGKAVDVSFLDSQLIAVQMEFVKTPSLWPELLLEMERHQNDITKLFRAIKGDD
jgi:hypothetical protein